MTISNQILFLVLLLIKVDHSDAFVLPVKFRYTRTLKPDKLLSHQVTLWDDSETSWTDQNKSTELAYPGDNPIREMIERAGMDISSM